MGRSGYAKYLTSAVVKYVKIHPAVGILKYKSQYELITQLITNPLWGEQAMFWPWDLTWSYASQENLTQILQRSKPSKPGVDGVDGVDDRGDRTERLSAKDRSSPNGFRLPNFRSCGTSQQLFQLCLGGSFPKIITWRKKSVGTPVTRFWPTYALIGVMWFFNWNIILKIISIVVWF